MEHGIFYLVGCSQDPDGGIYVFGQDNGGAISRLGFAALPGANYLARSRDGKTLYASGGKSDFTGYVAAFRIGADGGLSPLGERSTDGLSCCHLCVSPDGKRLYAANYRSGSVAGFRLEADGGVGDMVEFDQHSGHGTDPVRQEGPHAHYTGFAPDGKFLFVNDLGLDTVFAYPYTSERGIDIGAAVRNEISPAGSGPRHLIFEPEGTCLLINEMGNSIQRYKLDNGRFSLLAAAPTLPEKTDVKSKAAAVRLSPDGRFILASNRGLDTMAVFERKTLKRVFIGFSGGKSPRDFAFLPDGATVAVANEFELNVAFFDFDTARGTLTPNGREIRLPRPLCVFL